METIIIHDKWGKSRRAIKTNCANCGKEYLQRLYTTRIGRYCSQKCSHEARYKETERIEVICLNCDKSFLKKKWQVWEKNFCSKECKNKYSVNENHPGWNGGEHTYSIRAKSYYGKICATGDKCPLKDKVLPSFMYETDHIDGDRKNNKMDNLMVLCVWCHREKTMKSVVKSGLACSEVGETSLQED